MFIVPSKLYASEQLTQDGSPSCVFLGGVWQGVLTLVNYGQQMVMATVSQEDCNISINTSSTLPYGQFFVGHISNVDELLLYDIQTGEDWTTFLLPPTLTSFAIYDYVNNYTGLDKLELTRVFLKGDVDNNYYLDLRDAIIAARILTAMPTSSAYFVESDVNNDHKIGMEEFIFILREISK